MGLKVIGAGFGRTGTLSMKAALERLGYGPCHHMLEVTGSDSQRAQWRAIAAGERPNWDAAFAGFNAMVDWPGAHYWRELAAYYPEAKILLTLRSAESWWRSASETIFRAISNHTDRDSVGVKLIQERVFGGALDDKEQAIRIFEQHNAEVKATIPPERLLTFEIGDGWEPLCQFLNVAVPAEAFPRSNSTAEFQARIASPENKTS